MITFYYLYLQIATGLDPWKQFIDAFQKPEFWAAVIALAQGALAWLILYITGHIRDLKTKLGIQGTKIDKNAVSVTLLQQENAFLKEDVARDKEAYRRLETVTDSAYAQLRNQIKGMQQTIDAQVAEIKELKKELREEKAK